MSNIERVMAQLLQAAWHGAMKGDPTSIQLEQCITYV
jgi:hypothetical protein